MSKTLVYVNKEKIVGLSVPFIGSEVEIIREFSASGGFNWLLHGELSKTKQEGMITQTRDLLPENIAGKLIERFPNELKFDSVDNCTKTLKSWEQQDNIGKPILVSGILQIPGINFSQKFDPVDPPNLEVKNISYNGENCFVSELTGDGVKFPVYFNTDALSMVGYCNGKNVEVIGLLSFVPWYDAGKDRTINSILIGVAIWVK